jgi:hypothetical protein
MTDQPRRRFPPPWTGFIVRATPTSRMSIMRVIDGWRGERQMTEPVTDENFYNENAPLLGHVALAWNDCHSVVFRSFIPCPV